MKIALAQLNFHIGNFEQNTARIKGAVHQALQQEADLVVFPELAVSGYPPRDFLEFDDFIEKCKTSVESIAEECQGIAAVLGAPVKNESGRGKRLYNAACFLNNGGVEKIIRKTLLPTYDVFDEYRYFEPNTEFSIIEYKGKKLAVTICEDLWGLGDNPIYAVNPMDRLASENPDMIINIAASPYDHQQIGRRRRILQTNALQYKLPVIYVNHVGAQTELIFDGGSCVMDAAGRIIKKLPHFEQKQEIINLEADHEPLDAEKTEPGKISSMYDALVLGVRNYFRKLGFTKAVLGLSGGIDSAVSLAIATEALGAENVLSVMMPSQFSSDHSVSDSEQMVKNLGSPSEKITIREIYEVFEEKLRPHFKGSGFDITEENIQARVRAILLMAFSNKFGHILLNTSNKSEAAVGYGTLYGDMSGGLSVIGDVYKTEVYELARYINRNREIIPESIIRKPPSAELRPDQKDSDSLPPYDILDSILYMYIEQQRDPADILSAGFEPSTVRKVLRLVNISEHKRKQAPPVLRVSPKAFGMGRRMPIVARYLT